MTRPAKGPARVVRCAVYTRKSTEEGLQMEFNSLDAQRESAEAYIRSQQNEGWLCLPDRFDDGGYSGGTIERPGLRRLMSDIAAGKIDVVACYKVDRLSRSLLDFARLMEVFEKHNVAFVSVTQQFSTTNSMGRLTLNVLLSFAQFERELVSERTRDKIAATKRKGKWCGGKPVLGYDVDAKSKKLQVNKPEAERVRTIFKLYLQHEALLPVVRELVKRGWKNKQWSSRKGRSLGGDAFTKTSLYRLLTNVVYAGQVRYKTEVHPGEHQGIVPPETFAKVQTTLRRNGVSGGSGAPRENGSLLRGLLRCRPCGCAMISSTTSKQKARSYRYYVCTGAQKKGWDTCPSKSVPAGTLERFVLDQIRCIGSDGELRREVVSQANAQEAARRNELLAEQTVIGKDTAAWHAQIKQAAGTLSSTSLAQLSDLQERVRRAEERLAELNQEIDGLGRELDDDQANKALVLFDPVWDALTPAEQGRALRLVLDKVEYDGGSGNVAVTYRPTAIRTLAQNLKG